MRIPPVECRYIEYCSDSDSDAVIDIEAIDELGSIMAIPDKLSTFSSARTAPINVLPPQKTSTTTEKAKNPNHDNELPKNSSRQVSLVNAAAYACVLGQVDSKAPSISYRNTKIHTLNST